MSKNIKKLLITLFIFIIDLLSMTLFKNYSNILFPYYRNISKVWIGILAFINSFIKVAVWDILLLIIIVLTIIVFIKNIINKKSIITLIINYLLVISILATSVLYGWFLNHYAPSLKYELNLDVHMYTVEDLYDACEHYLLKASEYSNLFARDDEYHLIDFDFYELAELAGKAYKNIEDEYPIYKGIDVRVKKISLLGEYLRYNGISGMFMPLTGEAGVPGSNPNIWLGFDMAHEVAHRLGIASEKEANFSAFLACINNQDSRLIYSGYYAAFAYTFSALYKEDKDKALELYDKYDDISIELIKLDRYDAYINNQKYESKLQDVSDKINDTYLKMFSHDSGIKSYGEVVDYLIAYYIQKDV